MKREYCIIYTLLLIALGFNSCKKNQYESDLNSKLKEINFSSDFIIEANTNRFICVDYLKASIVKMTNDGIVEWEKHDMFEKKDPEKKEDEKPIIMISKNGNLVICEQIVDSFAVNTNQFYTYFKISIFDSSGKLAIKKIVETANKKKLSPYNLMQAANNNLILLGIVETNKICNSLSFVELDQNLGILNQNTINTAPYWLNGIYYNANTYMQAVSDGNDILSIIQIGTQTSCFKFDLSGHVLLYKRFKYVPEVNIQEQKNSSSFWEYKISNLLNIGNQELLITGLKYSSINNSTSSNAYYTDVYTAKINNNFDSITSKNYVFSNYQFGSFPVINVDNTISLVGFKSEELGGEKYLDILNVNKDDLQLRSRKSYADLIGYKGLIGNSIDNSTINVIGVNSAFGGSGKHTFIAKLNLNDK